MSKTKASASSDQAKLLLHYATSLGKNAAELLATAELSQQMLESPDGRLPIQALYRLWQAAAQLSGDGDFGLHFAEAAHRLSNGGVLFSVMANCANVGSALEKLACYHNLATDFVQLHLNRQADPATYAWTAGDPVIPLERHYTEMVLVSLVMMVRGISQGQVNPLEVHFQHPAPANTSEHERIFGCRLVFDSRQNGMTLRREDLERPILLANAQLLERLEQFVQEKLVQLYPPNTWSERVAQQINRSLGQGEKPCLEAAAADLALSGRQLQNKLREEGVTYQALLDQVRKEAALKYLDVPEVSVCEVAFLLGFSEQSAFNHAFKRWTGFTPRDYRALRGR